MIHPFSELEIEGGHEDGSQPAHVTSSDNNGTATEGDDLEGDDLEGDDPDVDDLAVDEGEHSAFCLADEIRRHGSIATVAQILGTSPRTGVAPNMILIQRQKGGVSFVLHDDNTKHT